MKGSPAVLAILAKGKPKGGGDAEADAGKEKALAARELREALTAKDDEATAAAFASLYQLCADYE